MSSAPGHGAKSASRRNGNARGTRTKERRGKRQRTGTDALKLIGVSEGSTGVLLYQKVYRWSEGAKPEALGSLVQSFFQFSREIDDGSISCVNFERPMQTHAQHRRQVSNSMRRNMRAAAETMQLLCLRDPAGFVVQVFHEIPGTGRTDEQQDRCIRSLLESLRVSFALEYAAKVEELRTLVKEVAAVPGGATEEQLRDIQCNFDGFEETVATLRENAFHVRKDVDAEDALEGVPEALAVGPEEDRAALDQRESTTAASDAS